VAANDWFAATRGAVEVDVAHVSNALGADVCASGAGRACLGR
jgi:hypothetical protein